MKGYQSVAFYLHGGTIWSWPLFGVCHLYLELVFILRWSLFGVYMVFIIFICRWFLFGGGFYSEMVFSVDLIVQIITLSSAICRKSRDTRMHVIITSRTRTRDRLICRQYFWYISSISSSLNDAWKHIYNINLSKNTSLK